MSTTPIPVSDTLADLRLRVRTWRSEGRRVGLVPTMGALHEGHISLVRIALESCERVATSIFVNPTQFAPNEDFSTYPRTFEDDVAKLAATGQELAKLLGHAGIAAGKELHSRIPPHVQAKATEVGLTAVGEIKKRAPSKTQLESFAARFRKPRE